MSAPSHLSLILNLPSARAEANLGARVESVAAEVLGFAGNYLCGFLSSKIAVHMKYSENEDALKNAKEELIRLKKIIKEEIYKADAEGKTPTMRVMEWLKDVQGEMHRVNTKELEIDANRKLLHGCHLNCRSRYRLSKEMVRMFEEVTKIIETGNSLMGNAAENPRPAAVEHVPGPSTVFLKAPADMLSKVFNLLKDNSTNRIGIWGMGGVGKTTLMKNLNNNLACFKPCQVFDMVIWITVSKDLDLRRIQSQIADRLNVELKAAESVERTAIRLHQRLLKESKILLLLDDVWEEIDLDKLGIPFTTAGVTCKIIITTRSLEVCRVMKTDKDLKVDVLSDGEGWWLFRNNAGDVVGMEGIRTLARSLAKECRGLPLALITVARAMRGKKRTEVWKDALMELRRSMPYINGIEREVFLSLKWSYDLLQGNNIKPCFLYCSLFPEDFSIEVSELVQYWRAEGLIDEQQNQEEAYNKGITLIENMKDSCLLESGEHEETVKLHDVVRDVSIWIGSKSEFEGRNFIRSGMGLTTMPEIASNTAYWRISLMHNKITNIPERLANCAELQCLLLQDNPLKEIPEGFFHRCDVLRILNLSNTQINHLPPSVLELRSLRTLTLRGCNSLINLPPLGDLKELQFLDLYGTAITELPKGMENLRNLRQLNLARTYHLHKIPSNMISQLFRLEELDMAFSAYKWDVKEENTYEDRATVEELVCLQRLYSIYIRIDCLKFLSHDISWIKGLTTYNIFVGPRSYDGNYLTTDHDERRVILGSIEINASLKVLLSSATAVVLDRCTCLSGISEVLCGGRDDFGCLKSVTVVGCKGLDHVATVDVNRSILPDIDELYLHRLRSLSCIISGQIPEGHSIWNIRTLHITECSRLVNLLSYDVIVHLSNLEEIKVSNCSKITELFVGWRYDYKQVLPNLRILELQYLEKLRIISGGSLELPSLKELVVQNCYMLAELPLEAHHRNILKIRGNASWFPLLKGNTDGWDIMRLPRNQKVIVTPTRF